MRLSKYTRHILFLCIMLGTINSIVFAQKNNMHSILYSLGEQKNILQKQVHLYKRCVQGSCTEQERKKIKIQIIRAAAFITGSLALIYSGIKWGVPFLHKKYKSLLSKSCYTMSDAVENFHSLPNGWKLDKLIIKNNLKFQFCKASFQAAHFTFEVENIGEFPIDSNDFRWFYQATAAQFEKKGVDIYFFAQEKSSGKLYKYTL